VSKNHIAIIDGYGFLFRAYHSLPSLTRTDGTPVGAIYGFTSMLMKMVNDFDSSHLVVVLDSGVKSFRHNIYPEYKAHRPPAPEDLLPQFPLVREAVTALGISCKELECFEADDVIATIASKAKEEGFKVTIISSDKDLMQLIDDNQDISMFDPLKERTITEKEVIEKFGVEPTKLLDLLSLVGDTSDNVPGVPSIGPKTAAELLNNFGTLEKIFENTHFIKQQKRREALENNKDAAFLSKRLITLDHNAPIEFDFDEFTKKDPEADELRLFLEHQGFKTLLARAKLAPKPKTHTQIEAVTNIIKNYSELEPKLQMWLKEPKLSISLEKNNLSNIIGIAIATSENNASYILINDAITLAHIKPILEAPFILKIIYDVKQFAYDLKFDNLDNFIADDIQLLSYITETGKIENTLSALIFNHIGDGEIAGELAGENYNQSIFIDKVASIAAKKAAYLIRLHEYYMELLQKYNVNTLYQKIERPLSKVLFAMEKEGIRIDINALNKLSDDFTEKIKQYEQKIFQEAGQEFNIGSPKQLSDVLFNSMGLVPESKNKQNSTNAEILEELAAKGYIIAEYILKWRHYSKLKNTYTEALPKFADMNARVHTTFLMAATSTGRLSSNNPNLQNIPIRSAEGALIRNAFIAKDGYSIIAADYSQIELRILASIANVAKLKEAFKNNQDIHKITASEMFDVAPDQVDAELRRKAKTINFGIIYGISAFGLAERLNISRGEAKKYIELYFARYPEIKQYMDDKIAFARLHGYVETIFGRRCYIKNINSSNINLRNFSERAAINAPIQGSQADIIKKAMNVIYDQITSFDAKMILQIHDELLFEVIDNQVENLSTLIRDKMENVMNFDVPLTVNIEIGNSWR